MRVVMIAARRRAEDPYAKAGLFGPDLRHIWRRLSTLNRW